MYFNTVKEEKNTTTFFFSVFIGMEKSNLLF